MAAIWKSEAGGEAVRQRYAAFLAHWPVANEQRRIPTSHGETFVVACGPTEAPPVLLLHGSTANSASWIGDVAAWAQHFRVYAVDMIGEPGFSAPERPPLASHVYAGWLGEVMDGLGVQRAALVGISLGGWLALEFATRHPERVSALALLCPGGVGRHKNVLLWAAPLMLLGPWGRKQIGARIRGPAPVGELSAEARAFGDFMDVIFANYRPRTERLPPFRDEDLKRLTMPLLTILGAKDVFIDSAGTRARIAANAPHAQIVWLPEGGHLLIGHTAAIDRFLAEALTP